MATTEESLAQLVELAEEQLRCWRDVGIAYETPKGRIKHLVSLAALGIPLEVDAA